MQRIKFAAGLRALARDRRGATAMEFALIVPVFCAMLLGTMQYGVLMFAYEAMQDTAREASRKLATGAATSADATTQARAALPSWVPSSAWSINAIDATAGNSVVTTISIPARTATVFGIVPMPSTLSASVSMRKEG